MRPARRLNVERLIEKPGGAKLHDPLDTRGFSQDKAKSFSIYDRCKVRSAKIAARTAVGRLKRRTCARNRRIQLRSSF
jgi:hypothetical protein